jgi:4-amino-4-deoxy-L-arabinose transferase-like glycosyltransferase
MKRVFLSLGVIGAALLVVALVLRISGYNLHELEKVITSDGSLDDTALHAFTGLWPGLIWAALGLLVLGAVFYLTEKDIIPLLTCRRRNFLIGIIGIQFLLGLLYISVTTYMPYMDTEWYLAQAKHLAQGTPIVDKSGQPTAYWPIGYPLFLSGLFRLFGTNMFLAQILNVLLICGTTLLSFFTALRLHNEDSGRRTAMIMAFFPSQIFYTMLPVADIFFSFQVLLLLFLTLQKSSRRNTILLGLVLGTATLTRPVVLFFGLIIGIYRLMRDRRLRVALSQLVVIGLLCEAVLLPWQIRNYQTFGTFVLVSNNGGVHLWMGNNPVASGGFMPDNAFIPNTISTWMSHNLNEAQQSQYCSDQAVQYILGNPINAIKLWPRKVMHLFFKDSHCLTYGFFMNYKSVPANLFSAMIALTEGYYYALGLAFVMALWMFLRREVLTPRAWIIFGTLGYFVVIYLPYIAEGRYHMPLLPLLAFLASYQFAGRKAVQVTPEELVVQVTDSEFDADLHAVEQKAVGRETAMDRI